MTTITTAPENPCKHPNVNTSSRKALQSGCFCHCANVRSTGSRAASGGSRARVGGPTRLGIALALSEADELCVCDVAWIVSRAENLVGHHLRALREAGLARSRRDGKIVFYGLTAPGQALVAAHRRAVQVPV